MKYRELTIATPAALMFGRAATPLTTRAGMVIGGGTVYPELNFTLPAMTIDESSFPEVRKHYQTIVAGALRRAAELESPGVQLEFETLPPMTWRPEWGLDLTRILLDGMHEAQSRYGLKSVLRLTPNDNREMVRPPQMRGGQYWDSMLQLFNGGAAAGAELLSIESVGGKEVHDEALTMCNLPQVVFALCILGARDMRFLWTHIAGIARQHGVHAAGDTACGFGNTAMVLAEQRLIPRVFAAIVRPITAVRSLVAYECGAVGPGKDCGYENPYLKAITGYPMAMEGKTAACAHFSALGNIAAATCDLWSNESVQNIKLLGGMAPTCFMEQLIYDCRLMNQASGDGEAAAHQLQDWLVRSDAGLDPQAYILTPANVIALAQTLVAADSHYHAGRAVGLKAVEILRQGVAKGELKVPARELVYLDRAERDLAALPDAEDEFIAEMLAEVDLSKFRPQDYELA